MSGRVLYLRFRHRIPYRLELLSNLNLFLAKHMRPTKDPVMQQPLKKEPLHRQERFLGLKVHSCHPPTQAFIAMRDGATLVANVADERS
jgi:hypothetical protein